MGAVTFSALEPRADLCHIINKASAECAFEACKQSSVRSLLPSGERHVGLSLLCGHSRKTTDKDSKDDKGADKLIKGVCCHLGRVMRAKCFWMVWKAT